MLKVVIMIFLKIVNSRYYLIEIEDFNFTWTNRKGGGELCTLF